MKIYNYIIENCQQKYIYKYDDWIDHTVIKFDKIITITKENIFIDNHKYSFIDLKSIKSIYYFKSKTLNIKFLIKNTIFNININNYYYPNLFDFNGELLGIKNRASNLRRKINENYTCDFTSQEI